MRALLVAIDLPVLDGFAGFLNAGETMLVQAFLAVSLVETLDVGVLGGLAGVDEIELNKSPRVCRRPST